MKKRIFTMILVICMVFSIMPMGSYAADEKGTATNRVYVFTKVEGDTTGMDLELNAHGWYTLGYVDLDSKYAEPELLTLEEVKAAIANGKFTSVHNESIDINEVEFTQSGIFWETDAEDMGRGRTIHMDGILRRKSEEPAKPSTPSETTTPAATVTLETPARVITSEDQLNPAEAVEEISDDQIPLGNYEGSWALLNLLLTIGTAFLSVILLISCFGKKDEKEDEQTKQTENKKIYRKVDSRIR